MKHERIDEHAPDYPQKAQEELTVEEALAILRSPAREFAPEELHAVGIVPMDTPDHPAMRITPKPEEEERILDGDVEIDVPED